MTKVLDHGYVKLIEHMGSDERIIESARMSTGKGFLGWGPIHATNCGMHPDFKDTRPDLGIEYLPLCTCKTQLGDEKLLRTLYTKNHTTPFEMCEVTFEVQAPIFVFREWHRHRTQSYNEFSARYSQLPDLTYIPDISRFRVINKLNKQESGITDADEISQLQWLNDYIKFCRQAESLYTNGLNIGIAKEVARLCIPVSRYSKMRAKANLLNWLRFLRLRLPENAQWEIRQYANVIRDELTILYPKTMQLFSEEMNK